MKKICYVFIIVMLLFSCRTVKLEKEKQITLIKDSMLIGSNEYRYLKISKEQVKDLEILPINVYKLKKTAKDYDKQLLFQEFLKIDPIRFNALIFLNTKVLGYIKMYKDNNCWRSIDVKRFDENYTGNNFLYDITEQERESLYEVYGMPGYWLDKNSKTLVYDFYQDTPRFIPVKQYIDETIRDAFIDIIDWE